MKDTNVLFIWEVREELRDYLEAGTSEMDGVNLVFPQSTDDEDTLPYAKDAHIIVGWRPTEMLLDSAENLRLFINPGAGVQHQIERFRKLNKSRRVLLANGHGNSYFAAQHTVAILLALMNRIIPHHNWMVDGRWRTGDSDAISTPLRLRHVGFLGYGAVNSKVHRFLDGFDLEFSILKNSWEDAADDVPDKINRFTPDELGPFLENIDILIIAVPQTTDTVGMIGKKELELLGADGILVNVGRGPIVDEGSLFNALNEKKIAGAAIDVWYDYRPEPDEDGRKYPWHYPFHTLENVVLSPHRGASPMSDLKRWDEVVENIRRVADGESELLNIVDLEKEY